MKKNEVEKLTEMKCYEGEKADRLEQGGKWLLSWVKLQHRLRQGGLAEKAASHSHDSQNSLT